MKKQLYLAGILMMMVTCGFAQMKLEVTVKGIKEVKGAIRVGLFSTEGDFLKKAAYGEIVKVNGSEVTVVFSSIPSGDYALSVIHDENENGELDTNVIGIPKEGFAFGNNAMGAFGPPDFKEAKVKVDASHSTHEITLKYI